MATVSSSNIVIVGLNPALQKRLILPHSLQPGNVHRITKVEYGIGGKGQDVAVALSCLRPPPPTTTATSTTITSTTTTTTTTTVVNLLQFVGNDDSGDEIMRLLRDKYHAISSSDSSVGTVRVKSPLRVCTTLIATGDSNEATELVEPSGMVTTEEWTSLMTMLPGCFSSEDSSSSSSSSSLIIDAVCVMGSMPPGCPPDAYAKIVHEYCCNNKTMKTKKKRECLVLMDTVIGLNPLMDVLRKQRQLGDQRCCCYGMLKINYAELCRLVGMKDDAVLESSSQQQHRDITNVIRRLATGHFLTISDGLSYLAITDGKHPAFFVTFGSRTTTTASSESMQCCIYKMSTVDLLQSQQNKDNDDGDKQQLLYPIGAGDAVAAGTLATWLTLKKRKNHADDNEDACCGDLLSERLNCLLLNTFDKYESSVVVKSEDGGDDDDVIAMAAFGFGLACGSASCLQCENSVLTVNDVERLLKLMDPPVLISTIDL